MIHVTVYRSNNQITAFELSGHADSGPYGYDLVCAGVSAVSFGAVNAVLELCEIDLDIEQGSEGGYLHVALPDTLDNTSKEKMQLLFEGMIISLKTIASEYSQFITIKCK
ncbi:ribosomal-processing cysteine protease Prp [Lentibacillus sp. Marseille-P4043]|uniref:ribosomal-processing cysteine protease Prp n=1 Tax=Lentibacillus sp. Marseille-P4043 TaxID=2040293 RepID=UPI000D0AD860|nr:ribosomal-processing cysteine protease Prp [Lentibacillus sp. Marseille-P4043]